MEKKNDNFSFENSTNEKQNSLSSGIRIGLGGGSLTPKYQFVRVKNAEYATDFDFFVKNQVHVVHHTDGTASICSSLESRCFKKDNFSPLDDKAIMETISRIHRDIVAFKYGGELVYRPFSTAD
ncbi:MAG: hypothetical protein ACK5HT_15755 [Draconibacterium sp.]